MIDLFSDTKSRPSEAMRRFMMRAEVGDEQKDEDPTVRTLCERVADMLGKESAVYLPSGTMCNEISLAVHCRPGEEVICDRSSHIIHYEAGGPAALSGVMIRTVDGHNGIFNAEQLGAAIRPESRYAPRSRLVCVEQTANLAGGRIWPLETIREVMTVARQAGLSGHLDGARLLNAVAATRVAARSYAEPFDSAWIDLTKGLGAPVGAVLAGSRDFIREAWRLKQMWGGAMRQAGIIAAAGVYALDHNVNRLVDDHDNAQRLARGLAQMDGIGLDPADVETNMVFFDVAGTGLTAAEIVAVARERGVLIGAFGPSTIRAVTHIDVSEADVDVALQVLGGIVEDAGRIGTKKLAAAHS
ncbi:low specificity L-threonine aldolase [Paracoccus suum]|uniref:Low specificity L-threonine aldolase n=2 Tax=Paracoccus suum TaxID=2259340 RepID=A0A344PN05_9RHOB|nr:low specificity L-threonine aldolase [Paracoccus suum]